MGASVLTNLRKRIQNRIFLNSSRVHLERFNREFAKTMLSSDRVLDAGAGIAPYKAYFQHLQYESADFEQVDKPYAKSTYVCDLCDRIPVEDGRFNNIVFNQTLEHLKEPAKALSELYRVLAPNGRILCSVPLFYQEHEQPYDFFRYTQFGLGYLFAEAGFEVERIEWLEGFFGTSAYMFQTMYYYLPARLRGSPFLSLFATPFLIATRAIALFAAAILYRLDLCWKVTHIGFPKNYVVMARKPEKKN